MIEEPAIAIADFLGGFVAAEGHFARALVGPSRTRPSFTFQVILGARDVESCRLLHAFLGVGRLRTYPRRKEHYDDEVVFAVRSLPHLVDVVVPFLDAHLPPSYKRDQYEVWRAELLDYDAERRARKRPLS